MARRFGVAFGLACAVSVFAVAQGCSSNGDASGPADCVAAGGQCVIGSDENCAKRGPQDCDNGTPAGFFCCLAQKRSCQLCGACSTTQPSMASIAGCVSNCQCVDGMWQAPCPQDVPQSGSACTGEGTTCGYLTQASACTGSVDCYCQSGTWSCAPTCAVAIADDGGSTPCTAAGGQCVFGGCANAGPQDCGSPGMFCCLNDVPDAGADAGTGAAIDADACAASGCTGSCIPGTHNVFSVVDGCVVWQCCVQDDVGPIPPADASAE